MDTYEIAILLGSRIGIENGDIVYPQHTQMRAVAAGVAYQQEIAKRFVITGGHNFFVRYELNPSVPVYGTVQAPQRVKALKKKG